MTNTKEDAVLAALNTNDGVNALADAMVRPIKNCASIPPLKLYSSLSSDQERIEWLLEENKNLKLSRDAAVEIINTLLKQLKEAKV